MIVSDLYTADLTINSSPTQTIFTKMIPSIPIENEEFSGAYWLGWIKNTNLSRDFKCSKFTIENDICKIENVTNENENYDFTYFATYSTDSYLNTYPTAFYSYHTTSWRSQDSGVNSDRNKARLLNEMFYQGYSLGYIMLNFVVGNSDISSTGTAVQNAYYGGNLTVKLTINDFIDFINGDSTLTLTHYGFRDGSATISISDFNEYGIITTQDIPEDPEQGINAFKEILFIAEYQFSDNYFCHTNNNTPVYKTFLRSSVNTHINTQLIPTMRECFTQTGDFCSCRFSRIVNGLFTNLWFSPGCMIYNPVTSGFTIDEPVNLKGANASFMVSELNDRITYPKINNNVIILHSYDTASASSFRQMLYNAINPSDIYKHAALYRWYSPNTTVSINKPGYQNNVIYYPKVNLQTNEFLCELITGDEAYVKPLIPTWMKYTLSENTYQESDKPTPTPPTPEGEDTTEKHNNENSLPVISGIRTVSGDAFSTFYDVSMYHVAALGNLLSQMPSTFWEALGTATDYKQANILDYLVSLKWYPLAIADASDTQTNYIQFGFNGVSKIDLSAVSGTTKKLNDVNRIYHMGSVTVPYRHTQQTFLDLEPYTSVSAYLPYIGTVALQSNDVVGYTITCTYIVDLTTGMCTGILDNGTDTIYIGTGKIGVDISVSGNDILTQSEKMASSYLGAATGAVNNVLSLGSAVASENVVGAAGAAASGIADLATSAISIANSKRGIPETVGAASGFGGGYTHQTPYIKVLRPAVSIPASYGHDVGYVCNKDSTIGALSGYTVCQNPDLSGIPATAAELDMIRSILCSGFYA